MDGILRGYAEIIDINRHYKHRTKKGIVTVSGHSGKDMPVGTLLSVFKQAQIEKED
jgi:hypothetical protein